jgi:hypothetical protein
MGGKIEVERRDGARERLMKQEVCIKGGHRQFENRLKLTEKALVLK